MIDKANALIDAFTKETGIQRIGTDFKKWMVICKYMAQKGVTPKDIVRAIYHIRQDGSTPIQHPGSVKARAISIHSANRAYES